MLIGYLSTLETVSFGPRTRMHRSVLCRHIYDKKNLYEVEASSEGLAQIAGSRFQLGWCKQCQPVSDWGHEAACRAYPPRWWLDPTPEEEQRAKAICRRCVVLAQCLAVATRDDPAICGGLNGAERQQVAS